MRHLHNRALWRLVLTTILVPLALIAFWPSPVDQPIQGHLGTILQFSHRHGVPSWFNYQLVEAAANVTLFIPFGFVSAGAFPGKSWWQIGALGLSISGGIELVQLLFLHDRFASPLDVVTNITGAILGTFAMNVLVTRRQPVPQELRTATLTRSHS